MVPEENAVMSMPNERIVALNSDHIEMTKLVHKNDLAYDLIVGQILDSTSSKPLQFGKFSI